MPLSSSWLNGVRDLVRHMWVWIQDLGPGELGAVGRRSPKARRCPTDARGPHMVDYTSIVLANGKLLLLLLLLFWRLPGTRNQGRIACCFLNALIHTCLALFVPGRGQLVLSLTLGAPQWPAAYGKHQRCCKDDKHVYITPNNDLPHQRLPCDFSEHPRTGLLCTHEWKTSNRKPTLLLRTAELPRSSHLS